MKSKIYKVKRDLRALKKGSHALERLIEIRGMHFKRIDLLASLPKSSENEELILKEKEIISALRIAEQMKEHTELESKYVKAIDSLSQEDKAMVLDCFMKGMPYRKLAMEYGYSEEGIRKHIGGIITKIASRI